MDSTGQIAGPGELADELLDVVHQLRAQLARHAKQGAWCAPGGASPRTESMVEVAPMERGDDVIPARADALARATGSGMPQGELADSSSGATAGIGLESGVRSDARLSLAQVREELGDCKRCKLHTTRTNLVFGVGSETAPLMFIGEAPGEQEDLRGEPFVGRAGELLDKMIEAMGWSRSSVYIANVLKSRPPNNRDPEPDEVAACSPFLDAQIRAIAPRVIVTLGSPAAKYILRTQQGITQLRGRFHERDGIRVMPTFHPAYLLRDPSKKREAWSDLKLVIAELEYLGITPPSPPRA